MKNGKDSSFGFLLSDVTRLFRKHFDRRATAFDLTRAQWRALKWLEASKGMHQSELADQLEMEPIAIGRVIDRLESAGFVERRADPTDRRRWSLYLTRRALAVVDDMRGISLQLRAEALRGISAADLARTTRTLESIKKNLLLLDKQCEKGKKA
ncbi:MAG: MarR family transcriptional regulator [Halioglobus sp.]|nr:MarR family transcriptional regulator [Halioglobus sp.]